MPNILERRLWLDGLVVVTLALLVHHPALHHTEFTLDDGYLVQHNVRLEVNGLEDLKTLLGGEQHQSYTLWRPLQLLTFALDRALFGGDPDGYHWTNVLLHALVSFCVWLLFRRLLTSRRLALAGALLFALHPIHAEATAGVVGRAEVLALLWTALGMLLHLAGRAREGPRGVACFVLSSGCFLLGFLSKEIALTGPFLLVLVEFSLRGRGPAPAGGARTRVAWIAPYGLHLAAITVYFIIRALVLGSVLPGGGGQVLGELDTESRLLVAALAARDNLGALLFPQVTSAHYPLPFDPAQPPTLTWTPILPWTNPAVAATLTLHWVLLLLGGWALTRSRPETRALGVGLVGFYLSLGPVSNVIPIGVVRADRLLYTPSLFGCLIVTALFGVLLRGRDRSGRIKWFATILALLLGVYATLLQVNARAWSHQEVLWRTSLERFPQDPLLHHLLAAWLLENQRADEAELHFRIAVEGDLPPIVAAKARCGLAACLARKDRPRALVLLDEARRIHPESDQVALSLADLYLDEALDADDPDERRRFLERAEEQARAGIGMAPSSYALWLRLGTVLSNRDGQDRQAEEAFTEAIARRPDAWEARFNRGRIRELGLENHEGALEDYRAVCDSLILQSNSGSLTSQERDIFPEALLKRALLALEYGYREEVDASLRLLQTLFPDYPPLRRLLEKMRAGGS